METKPTLNQKLKNLTVGQVLTFGIIGVLVLVGSMFIDQAIEDWKTQSVCEQAFEADGSQAVEECLQRVANRAVKDER